MSRVQAPLRRCLLTQRPPTSPLARHHAQGYWLALAIVLPVAIVEGHGRRLKAQVTQQLTLVLSNVHRFVGAEEEGTITCLDPPEDGSMSDGDVSLGLSDGVNVASCYLPSCTGHRATHCNEHDINLDLEGQPVTSMGHDTVHHLGPTTLHQLSQQPRS